MPVCNMLWEILLKHLREMIYTEDNLLLGKVKVDKNGKKRNYSQTKSFFLTFLSFFRGF